jgi:hypothetical protein
VLPRHVIAIVVSVESTVSTTAAGPIGKVCIVPTQVPANFLDRTGVEADTARDGVNARSVFDSMTRFTFGFADCSGAGVGLSSEIGASNRCAVRSSTQQTKQSRSDARILNVVKTYLDAFVF